MQEGKNIERFYLKGGKQTGGVTKSTWFFKAQGAVRKAVVLVIGLYQVTVSAWLRPCCRFYPSCSRYTQEAVEKYGVFHGLWLGAKRLIRCHPWGGQGIDPVP